MHAFLCAFVACGYATTAYIVDAVSVRGYIVDNYCWNQPDHKGGDDGIRLDRNPEKHVLHCLTDPKCRTQGYAILHRECRTCPFYWIEHQLDATGNALMVALAHAEQKRGGDRAFNEQIDVTGTIVPIEGGTEMQVKTLCITPSANNPSGATICHDNTTTTTTTTTPSPSPAPAPAPSNSSSSNSSSNTRTTTTTTTTTATTTTPTPTPAPSKDVQGSLQVSLATPEAAQAFIEDPKAKTAMTNAVARIAGVASDLVTVVMSIGTRRLQGSEARRLVTVNVDYTIKVPSFFVSVRINTILSKPLDGVQAEVSSALTAAGATHTVTVLGITAEPKAITTTTTTQTKTKPTSEETLSVSSGLRSSAVVALATVCLTVQATGAGRLQPRPR